MTKTVSLRMDEKMIDYLKMMSHYVSIERNQDLGYNDLIIEAVRANYPMPVETADGKQEDRS